MKRVIKVNENELKSLIGESVRRIISEMVNERQSVIEGNATWDVSDAMYNAGLSEDECKFCNNLDYKYTIKFYGMKDLGDWNTPPSYEYKPDKGEVEGVEHAINAIPNDKVRIAMLDQFRSWLDSVTPDMDYV
jgi:hypothetical protein